MYYNSINISKNNVTLSLYVDKNLKRVDDSGYLEISDGYIGKKDMAYDNLSWFEDFATNGEKIIIIMKDLKEIEQFYDDVIEDILYVFSEANRLKIL